MPDEKKELEEVDSGWEDEGDDEEEGEGENEDLDSGWDEVEAGGPSPAGDRPIRKRQASPLRELTP
ncbi:MAG: hypothetical protein ACRELB_20560, partial [Polyangiaceae bacterium]